VPSNVEVSALEDTSISFEMFRDVSRGPARDVQVRQQELAMSLCDDVVSRQWSARCRLGTYIIHSARRAVKLVGVINFTASQPAYFLHHHPFSHTL
jgi:hypothetical protein